MTEKLSAPISVSFVSNHKTKNVQPYSFWWSGRLFLVEKVGLHHTYRTGRTLFHVFSLISRQMFFRIILDTDNLHWRLEEISDGH